MPEKQARAGPLLDRRKLLLGLGLSVAAGVTYARQPGERQDRLGQGKLENIIPDSIGNWQFLTTSGLVVPTEDALSDALYSQVLTRVYVSPAGSPIMLLIAQSAGQTGLLQLHRPEFCYPAGGFTLSPAVQRTVEVGNERFSVNALTASQPGRIEPMIYWTRVGDAMPMTWADQRLSIALDNLRGRIPDAVLVRVSTVDVNEGPAFERLFAFASAMLSSIGQKRSILVANT